MSWFAIASKSWLEKVYAELQDNECSEYVKGKKDKLRMGARCNSTIVFLLRILDVVYVMF